MYVYVTFQDKISIEYFKNHKIHENSVFKVLGYTVQLETTDNDKIARKVCADGNKLYLGKE